MNKDEIAGYVALLLLVFNIIGIILGGGSGLIAALAFSIVYYHIFNKTIRKKQNLTKVDWILFIIIVLFNCGFSFLAAFL